MNRIAPACLVPLLLIACSSKKEEAPEGDSAEAKRLATLCVEASGALGRKMDANTYRETMAKVMGACADACNLKQANACAVLDKQVGALCKVSSDVCSKLCDPSRPGALTDAACKAKEAAAKDSISR